MLLPFFGYGQAKPEFAGSSRSSAPSTIRHAAASPANRSAYQQGLWCCLRAMPRRPRPPPTGGRGRAERAECRGEPPPSEPASIRRVSRRGASRPAVYAGQFWRTPEWRGTLNAPAVGGGGMPTVRCDYDDGDCYWDDGSDRVLLMSRGRLSVGGSGPAWHGATDSAGRGAAPIIRTATSSAGSFD